MKPNLFILGAPKCGTTAVATWLGTHPEIFMPRVKEPHYFSSEYRLTGRSDYEALYLGAGPSHRWAIDASVWYLYSPNAIPAILDECPSAKFIALVRDPVEMIPAMHEQQRFNGNELIADLATALKLNDRRVMGETTGTRLGYPTDHLAYFHSCAVGRQIERAVEIIPNGALLMLRHDLLRRNNRDEYARILRFLDLPELYPDEFAVVNAAKTRRSFALDALVRRIADVKRASGIRWRMNLLSRLRRWNRKERLRSPLESDVRETIRQRMAPDARLLERVLGEPLPWAGIPPSA